MTDLIIHKIFIKAIGIVLVVSQYWHSMDTFMKFFSIVLLFFMMLSLIIFISWTRIRKVISLGSFIALQYHKKTWAL